MSMVRCECCEGFFDSDQHPEGFYVESPDGEFIDLNCYVCPSCQERMEFSYVQRKYAA